MAILLKAIRKRDYKRVMSAISDYYAENEATYLNLMDINDFKKYKLPKHINLQRTLEVLFAMGYISYFPQSNGYCFDITLTHEGQWFFEREAAERATRQSEWIRYIITTLIALAALVKSFLPEIAAILERLGTKA